MSSDGRSVDPSVRRLGRLWFDGRQPDNQRLVPRLELVIGNDQHSAGMSVHCWVGRDDARVGREQLIAQRWVNKPQSIEECVRIAVRGLQWYLREAGLPPE